MGVDCLNEFHLWENYDILPKLVDMMIFNRESYTHLLDTTIAGQMLQSKYQEKVTFVPEMLSGLSSTEIRRSAPSVILGLDDRSHN
jgi:nicotinic acid mononucleotide adenylyltransferase